MDKSVLLEKRKNLLYQSSLENVIYLNKNFVNIAELIPDQEILNWLINPNQTKLILNKGIIFKKHEEILSNILNKDELINLIQNNHIDIKIPENNSDKEFNLSEFKIKVKEKWDAKTFKLIDDLILLNHISKIEFNENSIWKLHLSYGILYGCSDFNIEDKPIVYKAPIINIEIEVEQSDNGNILIFKRNGNEFINNEILLNNLSDQYEVNLNLDEYWDKIEEISIDKLDGYFKFISDVIPNIKIEENFSFFQKTIKKDEQHRLLKEPLLIKKCFIISIVNPQGGKLLRDYDQIIKEDYQFPTVDTIFQSNLNKIVYDNDNVYELKNLLNLPQKLAIANSLTQNTLIYGPPGTGKSEVVTSIIANGLLKNKNILVVSEKKAALDVIENRLGALSCFAMTAFNNNNNDLFYDRIIEICKKLQVANPIQIDNDNKKYNEILSFCQKLYSIINTKDCFGNDYKQFLVSKQYVNLQKLNIHDNVIRNLCNLINSLKQDHNKVASDILTLNEVINTVKAEIPIKINVNQNIFTLQKCKDFLNEYDKDSLTNILYSLYIFITEAKIINKKSFFKLIPKDFKQVNVNLIIDQLRRIVLDEIQFIPNYQIFAEFIKNEPHYMDYLIYYYWIKKTNINEVIQMINQNKELDGLIHHYWFDKSMKAKSSDNILFDFYAYNLSNKLKQNSDLNTAVSKLNQIASLKRRPHINKIIKAYYKILKQLFPIWILSPETVSSTIPLNKGEFDLGIFDESSQIRLERGLPLVYRCKFNVVSGDDKQLKPTSFFSRNTEIDELYEGDLDNVDSLLDKAKASNWLSFVLTNHYRSVNEALIYFSNKYFYNNNLLCITKNKSNDNPIELIETNGTYNREKGINEIEANQVISILIKYLHIYKSFIVITFNIKQAEHITLLASKNIELKNAIENELIKVKSLENVQGDEADVVIISIMFAKDQKGNFIQNFGPVNQNGGMNRINVMASRAKYKMIVIKSISSSMITNLSNPNTNIFQNFLQYVEEYAKDSNVIGNQYRQIQTDEINYNFKHIINEIKEAFIDQPNVSILLNEYIGSNKIDLVIRDNNTNQIKLFIMFDDVNKFNEFENDRSVFLKQIDKQKYFEDRGYKTLRINNVEWNINHLEMIKKIKLIVQSN